MSRPPLKSWFDVRDLFLDEFGVEPFFQGNCGPNNSVLMFYSVGGVNFIVTVYEHAGWEVFGAAPGNRVDESLDWIRQLAKVPA